MSVKGRLDLTGGPLSAMRPPVGNAMLPLAFFGLGFWELVVILLAVAVLLGVPVFVMAFVLAIQRRWRRGRSGGTPPRPAPGRARGS